MQEVKLGNYWRKSKRVKAIRITEFNIELLWRLLGAYYWPGGVGAERPYLSIYETTGYIGDWLIEEEKECFSFLSDSEFQEDYETHSERQNRDELYAKVFTHVISAMTAQDAARFFSDSNGELELVAELTTRKILGEFK